jgi:hypothetical protein
MDGKVSFMRRPGSILLLCVLLGFGVSMVVPAEDVPETAYDESETLPIGSVPTLAIATPASVAKAVVVRFRGLEFRFATGESELHKFVRGPRSGSSVPEALSDLTICLRC